MTRGRRRPEARGAGPTVGTVSSDDDLRRERADDTADDAGGETPHRERRRERDRHQVGRQRDERHRAEHRDQHRRDADLRGGGDAEHLADPRAARGAER